MRNNYLFCENLVIGWVLSFIKEWDFDSLIVYYFIIIEDSVLLECILEIVMRVVCFKNYIYELFL